MDDVIQRYSDRLLDSGGALSLLLGLLALGLIANGGSWRLLRNVITIAHEGGHAVVALLSGRTLNGIRLHSDTSGLTLSTGKPTGPGMVLTLFFGYPAVSLLGLGAAALVSFDLARQALWAAIALLAPVGLKFAQRHGMSQLLIGAVLVAGAHAGSFSPIAVSGAIVLGMIEQTPL